jgi:hypothetical protein
MLHSSERTLQLLLLLPVLIATVCELCTSYGRKGLWCRFAKGVCGGEGVCLPVSKGVNANVMGLRVISRL